MTETPATLAGLDWLVLALYFALLTGLSVFLSRRQTGTDDYFLARRSMPVWAVAFSVIATAISAATFIGAPDQSYLSDLTYLSAQIGQVIAIAIVALFFIPAFYRQNVVTVYELVGRAFGERAKMAASWTFMLGRVFANGARLYIAGLAVSRIIFGAVDPLHVAGGIAAISGVAILYTFVGGIRAVIWTEVIQTVVLVGAAVAAITVLLSRIPAGPATILDALRNADGGSKLTVVRVGLDPAAPGWGFDPGQKYTLLTALLGFTIFNLAAYGTDHDLTQRMLTCRSAAKGSRSAVLAILLGIPITLAFMAVGLLLFVFYQRPDIMGAAAPAYRPSDPAKEVFLLFILREMPRGVAGLMVAGLIATALSSLNSALNAMSSTFVSDFYRRIAPGRTERHYLRIGRAAVAGWGIILGGFACLCIIWQESSARIAGQTLLDFALSVMIFAYAGLVAVFCAAIFTRRGNGRSAIAALLVGFAAVFAMQPGVWAAWTGWMTWSRATPLVTTDWRLGEQQLAYPWVLLVASVLSFGVCCWGRREGTPT